MSDHALEHRLRLAWPPADWCDVTILVAVSGGADSVALLRALWAVKQAAGGPGALLAAHFNHRLRGAASDADEQFVCQLCAALGIELRLGRGDPAALQTPGADGLEAAARRARYGFLEETAGAAGARYVALAHTADDQAETILHRIIRGTGIAGLSGVPRVRPLGPAVLIRPMLAIRRQEVLAYLSEIHQPFREDASNADLCFTRNRIRHELLPLLDRDYHPGVADAIVRLGSLAGEAQAVVDRLVERILDRAATVEGPQRACLDAVALAQESPFLIREALAALWKRQGWPLQAMSLAQWSRLAELVAQSAQGDGGASRCDLPGGVTATAFSNTVCLERFTQSEARRNS